MATTIMTPEEVMQYGKRLVLFSEGKRRNPRIFVIEDGRIFQQATLYFSDRTHVTKTNPVEIMDIYNQIERVYSCKRKGVLLARRSRKQHNTQQRVLPLKKTGKGMGQKLKGAQLAAAAYQIMTEMEQQEAIKQRARQRLKQKHAV